MADAEKNDGANVGFNPVKLWFSIVLFRIFYFFDRSICVALLRFHLWRYYLDED